MDPPPQALTPLFDQTKPAAAGSDCHLQISLGVTLTEVEGSELLAHGHANSYLNGILWRLI